MSDELNRLLALPLAKRIAGLTVLAATHEETLGALREALETSEALRVAAEVSLDSLQDDSDENPAWIHPANPPSEKARVLMSVMDGALWLRDEHRELWRKVRMPMANTDMRYEWSALAEQGPFLEIRDDYSTFDLVKGIENVGAHLDALRRTVVSEPEFSGAPWGGMRPETLDALGTIYLRLRTEAATQKALASDAAGVLRRISDPSDRTLAVAVGAYDAAFDQGESRQAAIQAAVAVVVNGAR